MEEDKFYEMAEPYLKEVITKDYDLKKIAKMVKTRIEIFPDIKDQIDFFEELPEYDTAMYTHKKMKTNAENSLEVLNDVLPILEAQEDYSNDALFETLKGYVTEKGVKIGFVMWPIRTAVSGKQNTPGGATELMEVLGKEESLRRIRIGIALLQTTVKNPVATIDGQQECLGQLMDQIEDFLDKETGDTTVHLDKEKYQSLSNALRETLENWGCFPNVSG